MIIKNTLELWEKEAGWDSKKDKDGPKTLAEVRKDHAKSLWESADPPSPQKSR